tara:strand:- start:3145 stop:3669 length:525 start_codon:yes stop_codon:yes gene_type:complete
MVTLNTDTNNPNILQTNSFELVISKAPTISKFVQSVSIPGITMGEATIGTPFADRRAPGDKIIYSVLSVSFVPDEEFKVWKEIYEWITALGFPINFQQYGAYASERQGLTPKDPFSDASLIINDNQSNPKIKLEFNSLFPIALGDIPFSTSDTGADPLLVTADFQYTYYTCTNL